MKPSFAVLPLAVVLFHVAVLWRTGGNANGSFLSNLAQLIASLVAVVACFMTARRLRGFARKFWALTGASFILWALAQTGWIYYENYLHQVVPTTAAINVLFFFFFTPLGIALLLPPDVDLEEAFWPVMLDLIQLGIVLVTAYLYFFSIASFWNGRVAELNHAIRLTSEWRNYLLLAALFLRAGLTASPGAKRCFRIMAGVFAIYAVGESLYFHLTPAAKINTGDWLDLTWSIPFAVATWFALTQEEIEEPPLASYTSTLKTTLGFHLMPLAIPIFVLLMASQLVSGQLALAAISVAASFLCAGTRVIVSQVSLQRAVETLKETEERFRLLFAGSPHPMWVFDRETLRFLEVNQTAIEKYGYSRNEFLAMTLVDIRSPENLPALSDGLSQLVSGEFSGEAIHRAKNGEKFHASLTGRVIEFAGRPAAMVLAEDITERKRADAELRRSQQMLALHIQQTPLAFIEWDVNSHVTDWNPAAERIFGYTKQEALGRHSSFITAPDDRDKAEQACDDLHNQRGAARGTNRNLTKSKRIITCDWYNTTLIYDSGQVLGFASLVQDVTEQHTLEEQLRQSQKMEAVGTLAGGVAHDFNNLLTVITGYSSLLQTRFQQDQQATEELQEIKDASQRASSLTDQLLTFSRKQVSQPILLNLNESVRNMEKMLGRLIGEDVTVESKLAENLRNLKVDPGQIEQVIMNLAVNARDAMPKGGTLRFETSNVTSKHPNCPPGLASEALVLLTASDTGCGMDAETRHHMFEPFFTTKKGGGTGLGLSTVLGIVQDSKGAIAVESAIGVGTTFYVYFPVASGQELPSTEQRNDSEVPGGTETILLVEDEAALRELASKVLCAYGYQVLAAGTAAEAEAVCIEFTKEIHLLITDVVLPELSGPEIAKKLTLQRPNLKVLFMSGYTDNALTRQALMAGDINFLQKPFSSAGLAQKVRMVLAEQTSKSTSVLNQ